MQTPNKSLSLKPKDFNSAHQNYSPCKKSQLTHQSHSKTGAMSFQNTQTSYAVNSGGVSYAELQIILENVRDIKLKASQQIKRLEKKNKDHENEKAQLKSLISRYENVEDTIKEQKKNTEIKYQGEIAQLKIKVQEKERNEKEAEVEGEKKNKKIDSIKNQIQEKQKSILKLEDQLSEKNQILSKLGIDSKSSEIKTIESKYKDIPSLLSNIATLQNNYTHCTQENAQHKQTIQNMKIQISDQNKIINTITLDNKGLNEHVLSLTEQLQITKGQLSNQNKKNDQVTEFSKKQYQDLEKQVQRMEATHAIQMQNNRVEINGLKKELRKLQIQKCAREDKKREEEEEAIFKEAVEEICDEYKDYEEVMRRVEYLEKYRSEHYFNVQKIQYLCKMLDA